ncbi:MAG TPA: PEGA domain-containing protein [Polyangia bacterium]|nr:PEGA domain-containing protein [Polyangia bacterium]
MPPRCALAAPAADNVKAEARERFDRGLALFEKGENAAALAEFKRAYELIANPVVLYNMGLVYAAMYRPIEAVDALDRFLGEPGKASVEQQRQARKVRDEQAARIASLTVVTDHPATVEIDGLTAGTTPMATPLRVVSGAHAITALAPGYQPARREVTLAGQVSETVTLSLVPTETGSAHVSITAPVLGAEVWINGKVAGKTPLPASVAVPPGEVRVELKRVGYHTATRMLKVDEGATANLEMALDENPADPAAGGRLRVTLSELGATDVTIDGKLRPLPIDALWLPVGPHVLTAARAGYEPYKTAVQIEAGQETAMVLALTPTLATRARFDEEAHGRRVLGWSLVGGGLAVAAGAGVFAIVTHQDVSNAQAALDVQLAMERDPTNDCVLPEKFSGHYDINHCGEKKAALQDDVDNAKLKRLIAYSGVGVGVLAAGIGAYLLATASAGHDAAAPATRVSLWQNGDGAGLSLAGSF